VLTFDCVYTRIKHTPPTPAPIPIHPTGLVRALQVDGAGGGGGGDEKYGETRLQVITDIDDTVKSSGGLRLLGKLGRKIVYLSPSHVYS